MNALDTLALVLAAAPAPSPSPTVTAATGGSPGFLGFVFTFGLAAVAVLLFLSLTRHLRVVDRRAKQLEADEAAEAEAQERGADGASEPDDATDGTR